MPWLFLENIWRGSPPLSSHTEVTTILFLFKFHRARALGSFSIFPPLPSRQNILSLLPTPFRQNYTISPLPFQQNYILSLLPNTFQTKLHLFPSNYTFSPSTFQTKLHLLPSTFPTKLHLRDSWICNLNMIQWSQECWAINKHTSWHAVTYLFSCSQNQLSLKVGRNQPVIVQQQDTQLPWQDASNMVLEASCQTGLAAGWNAAEKSQANPRRWAVRHCMWWPQSCSVWVWKWSNQQYSLSQCFSQSVSKFWILN